MEPDDLEQYALGILPVNKEQSIEAAVAASPHLAAEVRSLQRSLEGYAKEHGVAPRPALRNAILAAALSADPSTVQPTQTTSGGITAPASSQQVGTSSIASSGMYKRYAAIATVAFLLSAVSAVFLWNKTNTAAERLEQTRMEFQLLQSQNTTLQTEYKNLSAFVAFLRDDKVQSLKMESQPTAPQGATATLSWNSQTGEAYMHDMSLPAPGAQNSYQVWALTGDNTLSIGLIDALPTPSLRLKNVPSAQAFIVTLEPRGGSVAPAMERMYLQAKLKASADNEQNASPSVRKRKHLHDSDEPVPGYR